MKKSHLLNAILVGIISVACSDDDANTQDPIVGEWNQVRVIEMKDNEILLTTISNDCDKRNTQTFNADNTYSYKRYDDEFKDCELVEESVEGTWSVVESGYDIDYKFKDIVSGVIFDDSEDKEFETRLISVKNGTLRISYTFSNAQITHVDYKK